MSKPIAVASVLCTTAACGCGAPPGRPNEQTVASASPARTSPVASGPNPLDGARQSSECVPAIDLQAEPQKIRDRKPDTSDLRTLHTHAGVLVFNVRIDPSGGLADVRLVKGFDDPPWPTLAERWGNAISDWRYEPARLNDKPVAVCLTVTVIVHVT